MRPSLLLSPFLTIGIALAALLMLLSWGFRQAPEAAQRQLLVDMEAASVPVRPLPVEAIPEVYAEQDAQTEMIYTTTLFNCNIQRPSLPPREEMTIPIFPGCEGEADYEDRVFCGFRRFAEFISDNKVEPEGSKRERVGIGFVVHRQTGAILDVEVIQGKDQRNIDEALRVINLLVERDVRFIPSTRKGEPINFPLAVPVAFHGAGCGD